MFEMNNIKIPLKVLKNRQGFSKIDVALTLFSISLVVGIFAYLTIPYVNDAREVTAVANCQTVQTTAEICLNAPDPEMTFEEQVVESLGNDATIEPIEDRAGYYVGEFASGSYELIVSEDHVSYVSWTSYDHPDDGAYWTPKDGYVNFSTEE